MADPVPLHGDQFVLEVRASCDLYYLDPLAVFAVAMHAGLDGQIGDDGRAYGPWQLHLGGELPPAQGALGLYSIDAQAWAWSAPGIVYAIRRINELGARGLKGHAAVAQITRHFEPPDDVPGQLKVRTQTYDHLVARGGRVWGFLINLAGGPTITPAAELPSVSGQAPPPHVHAASSFRHLMKVLSRTIPARSTRVLQIAHRLPAQSSRLLESVTGEALDEGVLTASTYIPARQYLEAELMPTEVYEAPPPAELPPALYDYFGES